MIRRLRHLRWLLALATVTTALLVPAGSAQALYPCGVAAPASTGATTCAMPGPVRQPISDSYKGWAYVAGFTCPPGAMCPAIAEISIVAWRWTGSQWVQASLNVNEQVYAWPYVGTWHWAWTQRTGWVAVPTDKLYTKGYAFA
jgi:hypothetical protein